LVENNGRNKELYAEDDRYHLKNFLSKNMVYIDSFTFIA